MDTPKYISRGDISTPALAGGPEVRRRPVGGDRVTRIVVVRDVVGGGRPRVSWSEEDHPAQPLRLDRKDEALGVRMGESASRAWMR